MAIVISLGKKRGVQRKPKRIWPSWFSWRSMCGDNRVPSQLFNHPMAWLTDLQLFIQMHQELFVILGPGHKNVSAGGKTPTLTTFFMQTTEFMFCYFKVCGRTIVFFMTALTQCSPGKLLNAHSSALLLNCPWEHRGHFLPGNSPNWLHITP